MKALRLLHISRLYSTTITHSLKQLISNYTHHNSNFFQKLYNDGYKSESIETMKILCKYTSREPTTLLILNNLVNLYISKDFFLLKPLLAELQPLLKLSHMESTQLNNFINNNNSNNEIPQTIIQIIINFSNSQNQVLFSAATLIRLHDSQIPIPGKITSDVIDSLIVYHPTYDEYHIDAIIKLSHVLGMEPSMVQLLAVLEKCVGVCGYPIFANIFIEKLQIHTHEIQQSKTYTLRYLDVCYKLIQRYAQYENTAAVSIVWGYIRPMIPIQYHDTDTLGKIIRQYSKNKEYRDLAHELVDAIPHTLYGDVCLGGALLKYCGVVGPRTKIVNAVPRHESLLTDLLSYQLNHDTTANYEQTLSQIFNREDGGRGLNHVEFNLIVRNLLSRGEFDNVVGLINNTEFSIAKSAYLSVVNYYIDKNKKFNDVFMSELWNNYIKFGNNNDDDDVEFMDYFIVLFNKYLVKKFPLEISKKFLSQNTTTTTTNTTTTNTFKNINPFTIHHTLIHDKIQYLQTPHTDRSRIICIKTLLHKAYIGKDYEIFKWCVLELIGLGFGEKEMVVDCERRFRGMVGYLKKVLS